MFEKHEKWFILGIIALAIYYFYKRGKTQQGQTDLLMTRPEPSMYSAPGSLVNPTIEEILPAQTTYTPPFAAAQPATVPISQKVSTGVFQFYPAPPVLRNPPADVAPAYSTFSGRTINEFV